ncbi:MAG: FAD binding domain-containing protein [Anaerolineae bacterium]
MVISFTVNGQSYEIEADPRAPLLHTLREDLGLRGTKYGCGEGECGACSVILNGRPVNACLTLTGQVHGGEILTVEGLSQDEPGARLLDAFTRVGAVQCGFCTPGFAISARALLAETSAPDVEEIRRGLSGNLCRCTGYTKIIKAVSEAAQDRQSLGPTKPRNGHFHTPINGQTGFARPATLAEALGLLGQTESRWRVIAGGTDVLVQNEHRLKTLNLLDIGGLAELRQISERDDVISIGALVSYTGLIRSPLVQKWAGPLVMAAREVGGAQIQNMGTLGGNVVNASPAADGVPPLYVLEAQLVLKSVRGERTLPVQAFTLGPGKTVIQPDELLAEILIPKQTHAGQEIAFFEKVGTRKAQTIAKASVAFRGWLMDGRLSHVRVALGAVAPTVILAPQTSATLTSGLLDEAILLQAGQAAHNECSPIDDIRSTAAYRRKLVRGLLVRNLWPYVGNQTND